MADQRYPSFSNRNLTAVSKVLVSMAVLYHSPECRCILVVSKVLVSMADQRKPIRLQIKMTCFKSTSQYGSLLFSKNAFISLTIFKSTSQYGSPTLAINSFFSSSVRVSKVLVSMAVSEKMFHGMFLCNCGFKSTSQYRLLSSRLQITKMTFTKNLQCSESAVKLKRLITTRI